MRKLSLQEQSSWLGHTQERENELRLEVGNLPRNALRHIRGQKGRNRRGFFIAKSTRMVEWLLRFGLPLDVTNDKGETPLEVATPETRAVMEKWVLEERLGGDVKDATVQRRL